MLLLGAADDASWPEVVSQETLRVRRAHKAVDPRLTAVSNVLESVLGYVVRVEVL